MCLKNESWQHFTLFFFSAAAEKAAVKISSKAGRDGQSASASITAEQFTVSRKNEQHSSCLLLLVLNLNKSSEFGLMRTFSYCF